MNLLKRLFKKNEQKTDVKSNLPEFTYKVLNSKEAVSLSKNSNFSGRENGIVAIQINNEPPEGYVVVKGNIDCHDCLKNMSFEIPIFGFGGPEINCPTCGCTTQTMATTKKISNKDYILIEISPLTSTRGNTPAKVQPIINSVSIFEN